MQTSYADLAGLLEITPSSSVPPLRLIETIQHGLPVKVLYSISHRIAPKDNNFVYRIISKSSLNRRKQAENLLTPEESNRVARLANAWASAAKIWQNEEATRSFFFCEHPMLEGRKPIDVVLSSEFGAELVKDILGRLTHGTAA